MSAVALDRLQLIVIDSDRIDTRVLLPGTSVTIGRSPENAACIAHRSISRDHAILHLDATLGIEDLDSANGTWVKGQRIHPRTRVEFSIGEMIRIGQLAVVIQRSAPAGGSPLLCTQEQYEKRLAEDCARARKTKYRFAIGRIHCNPTATEQLEQETLGRCIRKADIIAALGNHVYEFLLADTSATGAEITLARYLDRLREAGISASGKLEVYPTEGAASAEELIALLREPGEINHQPKRSLFVAVDPAMQAVARLIEQVAPSMIGILLLGETGVGKEVFANAVHRASHRASGPFVAVNCAGLTESLLETELFGHERGAFTSAVAMKSGLLETAHGGTVFLDEIGDAPLATQAKLLRVIEERQLRRVGGVRSLPIDVRIVAATNCDLEADVRRGSFRADLFFRLNGITIIIPPLRHRPADIEPLARAFLVQNAAVERRTAPALHPDALSELLRHSWPGNVRELRNVIARAALLAGVGPIRPEHLPPELLTRTEPPPDPDHPPVRAARGTATRDLVVEALEQTGGNQTLAAQKLGVSRRTLLSRLDEYGLSRPRKGKTR